MYSISDKVIIQYTPDIDDAKTILNELMKFKEIFLAIVVFAVGIIGAGIAVLKIGLDRAIPSSVLFTIVALLFGFGILLFFFPFIVNFYLKRKLMKDDTIDESVTWEISEENVIVRSVMEENLIQWETITEIKESKKLLTLKRGKLPICLPKRYVNSSEIVKIRSLVRMMMFSKKIKLLSE